MFDKREPDKKFTYKKVNELSLPMWVFYPENFNENEKYDAVLCIHGGGWYGAIKDATPWDGSWMTNHAQYFSQKGKIGISISYRDLGYTEDTVTYEQIEDCIDALSFIKKNINYKTLSVIGDSAGAHLALCMGFLASDELKPEKIVACNPVTDLTAPSWKATAKTEDERIEISPLYMVDKINVEKKPEILCMHGDCDKVVPIEDTILFEKKLKDKGFESRMITVKGASHAFILWGYTAKEEDVFSNMKIVDEFLNN